MDPDTTSTENGERGKERDISTGNGDSTGKYKSFCGVLKYHNLIFFYPSIDFIQL